MFSTITSIIRKIRTWGLKGVVDFFRGKAVNKRWRRRLLSNAARYPMTPAKGITVITNLSAKMSLSKVMRDFVKLLKANGIPYQTLDLSSGTPEVPQSELEGLLTPEKDFRILKYDHVVEMFASPLPRELPLHRSRIIFWEFDSGLLEYYPVVANDCDDIVAMSDYNVDVFRKLIPESITVKKIQYPFILDAGTIPDAKLTRSKYGFTKDDFLVFFNFDLGSSFNRKNPDGAMRAFAKAFTDNPHAKLVFKTMGAKRHPLALASLHTLAAELGIADRMHCINDFLPTEELYALTAACDVYLSLHRGEGFGLGIAEAMSLGKPVVVTGYSGPTEFCNENNSILISYKLVDIPPAMHDHACYMDVKRWAEPDIDAAAEALRRLYGDSELRKKLGAEAKRTIEIMFSAAKYKESIAQFLM